MPLVIWNGSSNLIPPPQVTLYDRKNFDYDETRGLVVEVPIKGNERTTIERASHFKLKSLLFPEINLTDTGYLAAKQPKPPPEECYEWYMAQLIHYNLPWVQDKDAAKEMIKQVMMSGRLPVPDDLKVMEANMRGKARITSQQLLEKSKPGSRDLRSSQEVDSDDYSTSDSEQSATKSVPPQRTRSMSASVEQASETSASGSESDSEPWIAEDKMAAKANTAQAKSKVKETSAQATAAVQVAEQRHKNRETIEDSRSSENTESEFGSHKLASSLARNASITHKAGQLIQSGKGSDESSDSENAAWRIQPPPVPEHLSRVSENEDYVPGKNPAEESESDISEIVAAFATSSQQETFERPKMNVKDDSSSVEDVELRTRNSLGSSRRKPTVAVSSSSGSEEDFRTRRLPSDPEFTDFINTDYHNVANNRTTTIDRIIARDLAVAHIPSKPPCQVLKQQAWVVIPKSKQHERSLSNQIAVENPKTLKKPSKRSTSDKCSIPMKQDKPSTMSSSFIFRSGGKQTSSQDIIATTLALANVEDHSETKRVLKRAVRLNYADMEVDDLELACPCSPDTQKDATKKADKRQKQKKHASRAVSNYAGSKRRKITRDSSLDETLNEMSKKGKEKASDDPWKPQNIGSSIFTDGEIIDSDINNSESASQLSTTPKFDRLTSILKTPGRDPYFSAQQSSGLRLSFQSPEKIAGGLIINSTGTAKRRRKRKSTVKGKGDENIDDINKIASPNTMILTADYLKENTTTRSVGSGRTTQEELNTMAMEKKGRDLNFKAMTNPSPRHENPGSSSSQESAYLTGSGFRAVNVPKEPSSGKSSHYFTAPQKHLLERIRSQDRLDTSNPYLAHAFSPYQNSKDRRKVTESLQP